MIDPKYDPQIKICLERRLNRPALAHELINGRTDLHITMEILLQLHEKNADDIKKIHTTVGKVTDAVNQNMGTTIPSTQISTLENEV